MIRFRNPVNYEEYCHHTQASHDQIEKLSPASVPEWGLGDGYREPEVIIENCEAEESLENQREEVTGEVRVGNKQVAAEEGVVEEALGSRGMEEVTVFEVLSREVDSEEEMAEVIEVEANQEMSAETGDHLDIEVNKT